MKTPLKALLGLMAMLCSFSAFAQFPDWNVRGNTTDSSYFIGTTNHEILRIKTDSVDRIIVGVNDSIQLKGLVILDSVVIPTGHLQVDSIRARVIHVGDSSLILGNPCASCGTLNRIFTTATTNSTLHIGPNDGVTGFTNTSGLVSSTAAKIGIGTLTPTKQLQLWRNTGLEVVSQFTNGNTLGTATDGFLVGIDAAGAAVLTQQENAPINITQQGNANINFFTPSTHINDRGYISYNAGLGDPTPTNPLPLPATPLGDGLRIYDWVNTSGQGSIDLWTSTSNQAFIKVGNNGLIATRNSRLEVTSNYLGFWFNSIIGRYIFATGGTEHARVGSTNGWWRFGFNPSNVDPTRRVEIFDAGSDQLRLTQATGVHTDFQTNSNGNLLINPTGGRVGIGTGTTNPSHNLHVTGNARITNVPAANTPNCLIVGENQAGGAADLELNRLAFTGSTTDVLLGNGTWGAAPAIVAADNGLSLVAGAVVRLGQPGCTPTGDAQLVQHSYIPLNNFNLSFIDAGAAQTNTTNRIGIGICTPTAKLEVFRPLASTLSDFQPVGVRITNADVSTPGVNTQLSWGLVSTASGRNRVNLGGEFRALNAIGNTGVQGMAATTQSPSGSSGANTGGYFQASDNRFNYGVRGIAFNNSGGADYAGFFNGQVISTGVFIPNFSDINLKDSIQALGGALSVITELQTKQFIYKTDSFPYLGMPTGIRYGLIAQQVDTVLPELVVEIMQPIITDTIGTVLQDTMNIMAVDYISLIPIAIAGIQEQQAMIDTILNEQVTADDAGITDTNRVVKWSFTNRQLTNSLLYDDGDRLGLPDVRLGSFFNVENTGTDTVAANFTSITKTTEAVVNAVYTTDSGQTNVPAVRGYSKYLFEPGDEDGTGGSFEGGRYGVHGLASGVRNKGIGVFGESVNSDSKNTGVAGYAIGVTAADNIGVRGMADGSDFANGAFVGSSEYVNPTSINAAYVGYAAGSSNLNFGGDFEAYDTLGVNYGIYAYANGSAPDAYAGYFTGDVHATGTVTWTSDATLKNHVEDVNSNTALSLITRLQPKTYTFRTNDYPYLSLPQGNQYGLLAQDVQQVLPDLVADIKQPARRNAEGTEVSPALDYKGLNYTGLIPLLVGAVKEQQIKAEEQQAKIDSLSEVIANRLTELENRINGCCGTGEANKTDGGTNPNHLTVELSSTQVIILEQNVPNPFAEQTSISYFIPEGITNAQIVFTDILGNTIRTADVKSGYGVVTVFAQNLTSGQYSYSLIIDGKVVETKRMVKTK